MKCRQTYDHEKMDLAVRQLEDWAACAMRVIAIEGVEEGIFRIELGQVGDWPRAGDSVLASEAIDRMTKIVMCCTRRVLVPCWREGVIAVKERVNTCGGLNIGAYQCEKE